MILFMSSERESGETETDRQTDSLDRLFRQDKSLAFNAQSTAEVISGRHFFLDKDSQKNKTGGTIHKSQTEEGR